jgi:hypothetical protein
MERYRIVRHYLHGGKRVGLGMSGLTLEQAKAYCANPETSSTTCKKYVNRRRTDMRGSVV